MKTMYTGVFFASAVAVAQLALSGNPPSSGGDPPPKLPTGPGLPLSSIRGDGDGDGNGDGNAPASDAGSAPSSLKPMLREVGLHAEAASKREATSAKPKAGDDLIMTSPSDGFPVLQVGLRRRHDKPRVRWREGGRG
jgi:hypothetical protein